MRLTNLTNATDGGRVWELVVTAGELARVDIDWKQFTNLMDSSDISDKLYALTQLSEAVEALS